MRIPVRLRTRLATAIAWSAILTSAGEAQVIVKASDTVFFRLGTQVQFWADETEDPVSGGYSQNFFFRRVRLIVAGQVAPDLTFFFETDDPRLGNAGTGTTNPTKNASAGFLVQDAFGEWRVAGDAFILDAGLFFTPQSRNILTSSAAILSFDVSSFSLQSNALTGSSGGRDFGLQAKGYFLGDRLEYRAGVFAGQRQASTAAGSGSRNSPRFAARIQYDVFDPEKGYTYPGVNLGAKRILALGGWGDFEGDYRAWGADVTADMPVVGRSTVTATAQYYFYDGGKQFTQVSGGVVTPLLPKQHAFFADAGFFFAPIRLQPFLRYERLDFSDAAFESREQQRWGGGANYYVASQNMKVSAFYERIQPRAPAAGATRKNTNHFAVQLQFFYF